MSEHPEEVNMCPTMFTPKNSTFASFRSIHSEQKHHFCLVSMERFSILFHMYRISWNFQTFWVSPHMEKFAGASGVNICQSFGKWIQQLYLHVYSVHTVKCWNFQTFWSVPVYSKHLLVFPRVEMDVFGVFLPYIQNILCIFGVFFAVRNPLFAFFGCFWWPVTRFLELPIDHYLLKNELPRR